MTEYVDWKPLECDSTHGYSIQITLTVCSHYKPEIDKVKEWCEEHIGDCLIREDRYDYH